jgi:hypothetical protein
MPLLAPPIRRPTTREIHVSDYGAAGDGVTNDAPSIYAAIAVATKGDTLVFQNKVYLVDEGIEINKSINLRMNGGTLLLNGGFPDNDTLVYRSPIGPSLADWTEAIPANTNVLNVAISPATLPVGTMIFIGLGTDAEDADEEDYSTVCMVMANDGAAITIDCVIPYAITQGVRPHQIFEVLEMVENVTIQDLNLDFVDGIIPSINFWIERCRNVIVENLGGRFTIGFTINDCSNVTLVNISAELVKTGSLGDRVGTFWQCEDILVDNVKVHCVDDAAIFFLESRSRHIRIRNILFSSTFAGTGTGIIHVSGKSYDVVIDSLVIKNKGPIVLLVTGSVADNIRFGYVDISGDASYLELPLIERLRWQGTLYDEVTTVVKIVDIESDWSNVDVVVGAGLVRKMWFYITSVTGLTFVYILNSNNGGIRLDNSLTPGVWAYLPGSAGSASPLNHFAYPDKRLNFTAGTISIQTRLTAVLEIWHESPLDNIAENQLVTGLLLDADRDMLDSASAAADANSLPLRDSNADLFAHQFHGLIDGPAATFENIGLTNSDAGAVVAVVTGAVAQSVALQKWQRTGAVKSAEQYVDKWMLYSPDASKSLTLTKTATETQLADTEGRFAFTGNLVLGTAGNGLYIKEGTNATMGVTALVGGTKVVSTTKVTANSRIKLGIQALGTVAAPKAVGVTARTPGTSFTITSADGTDTSTISWEIIEPA